MSTSKNQPVTMMAVDHVRPDKVKEYETWLSELHAEAKKFSGFISVDIIPPNDPENLEYVVLLKFKSPKKLKRWTESDLISEKLMQLPALVQGDAYIQEAKGLEMWFRRPARARVSGPPYWKQVVVGIISVYPLLLLFSWLLTPVLQQFPTALALFFSVTILSLLLTYPVMPLVTRVLKPWLYPAKQG